MAKTVCRFQHTKNRGRKNGDKDEKALHKLINNEMNLGNILINLRNGKCSEPINT